MRRSATPAAAARAWLTATLTAAAPLTAGFAAAATPPDLGGHHAAAAGPGRRALATGGTGSTTGVVGGTRLGGRGVIVNYPSRRSPRLPKVPADAFLIADADTGQVLAAKNPHTRYEPASTLKILTAISLIPVLDPAGTVVASKRAVTVEPDVVGLKLGHRYQVADLFRALLMISGNDAAVALAEATGSFRRGIALMNAEAHELQADDTVAMQPNGLDARGQHSSAYDEALIARRALRMPAFLGYDETLRTWFPITPRHRIELFNQDRLLTTYRGFLGGKTGWTTPAKATYVGMARRNGHTLIVTLMHAVPGTLFASGTAMLNWGFHLDGTVRPVGWLVGPLPTRGPARTVRSGGAPRPVRASMSGRILMPFTAAAVAFAAFAVGTYVLARRRRAGQADRHRGGHPAGPRSPTAAPPHQPR